jgi:hypothetical protein
MCKYYIARLQARQGPDCCKIATAVYSVGMSDGKTPKTTDGGIAVGAYLKYLRESQGIGVEEVAEKIGTDQSQVWRIENWKSDTRSSLLFKFIRAVGGDGNDVELLLNNRDATKQDGETLAKLRLGLKSR